VPKIPNFESVDCFFIHQDELWLVQITIAREHPVKFNGLKKIVEALNWKKKEVRLVFGVAKDQFLDYSKKNQRVPRESAEVVENGKMVTEEGKPLTKRLRLGTSGLTSDTIPQFVLSIESSLSKAFIKAE
jgi:hypothetical protein